jgi:hypothetical protein
MPLLAPVIRAARARRQQMQSALGVTQRAAWRSMLASRWLPLPSRRAVDTGMPATPAPRTLNIAVDGTSHSVQLHTGAHFILAVAAACGPDFCQDERADMEILPARYDEGQASSARDLLMRSLEAYCATQAAGSVVQQGLAGSAILWIDGSLYADLSHMAGAPEKNHWGGAIERAGHIMRTTAALLDLAERSGLWLIGVGKTQRASFLYDALTAAPSSVGQPSTFRTPAPSNGGSPQVSRSALLGEDGHPADGELLATAGPGWSWPVVLDGTRFPLTSHLARETLHACPAIVSTYVRPHPADLPLRVDVPASTIGLSDRLLPAVTGGVSRPWPAWVPDASVMAPIVAAALAAYGGLHVYNAPLYAVDRLVRLPRRELELRYLPICERMAGLEAGTLAINRGRRRFLIA